MKSSGELERQILVKMTPEEISNVEKSLKPFQKKWAAEDRRRQKRKKAQKLSGPSKKELRADAYLKLNELKRAIQALRKSTKTYLKVSRLTRWVNLEEQCREFLYQIG